MIMSRSVALAAALVGAVALSACSGSNGNAGSGGGAAGGGGGGGSGGGGGNPPPAQDFDQAFNAAIGLGPSTDVLTGTARHTGRMNLITTDPGGQTGEIAADLNLTVDFDAASDPMSGTATNFAGTVNGNPVTLSGDLSTAAAAAASGNALNDITTSPLPAIAGSGELTGMSLELRGTLTEDDSGVANDVLSTLQGNFYGSDGAAIAGSVGSLVEPRSGTSILTGTGARQAGFGGRFYTDRN
ncbi:MAG: hypothetical protein ACLFQL_00455 [Paracoccaceae bacterium]